MNIAADVPHERAAKGEEFWPETRVNVCQWGRPTPRTTNVRRVAASSPGIGPAEWTEAFAEKLRERIQ